MIGAELSMKVTWIRWSDGGCVLVMDWWIGRVLVERHCIGDGVARVVFDWRRSGGVPGTKSSSVETLRSVPIEVLFPVPLRDCLLGFATDWRDMCQSTANWCKSSLVR